MATQEPDYLSESSPWYERRIGLILDSMITEGWDPSKHSLTAGMLGVFTLIQAFNKRTPTPDNPNQITLREAEENTYSIGKTSDQATNSIVDFKFSIKSDGTLEVDQKGTTIWGILNGLLETQKSLQDQVQALQTLIGTPNFPKVVSFQPGNTANTVFAFLNYNLLHTNPLTERPYDGVTAAQPFNKSTLPFKVTVPPPAGFLQSFTTNKAPFRVSIVATYTIPPNAGLLPEKFRVETYFGPDEYASKKVTVTDGTFELEFETDEVIANLESLTFTMSFDPSNDVIPNFSSSIKTTSVWVIFGRIDPKNITSQVVKSLDVSDRIFRLQGEDTWRAWYTHQEALDDRSATEDADHKKLMFEPFEISINGEDKQVWSDKGLRSQYYRNIVLDLEFSLNNQSNVHYLNRAWTPLVIILIVTLLAGMKKLTQRVMLHSIKTQSAFMTESMSQCSVFFSNVEFSVNTIRIEAFPRWFTSSVTTRSSRFVGGPKNYRYLLEHGVMSNDPLITPNATYGSTGTLNLKHNFSFASNHPINQAFRLAFKPQVRLVTQLQSNINFIEETLALEKDSKGGVHFTMKELTIDEANTMTTTIVTADQLNYQNGDRFATKPRITWPIYKAVHGFDPDDSSNDLSFNVENLNIPLSEFAYGPVFIGSNEDNEYPIARDMVIMKVDDGAKQIWDNKFFKIQTAHNGMNSPLYLEKKIFTWTACCNIPSPHISTKFGTICSKFEENMSDSQEKF